MQIFKKLAGGAKTISADIGFAIEAWREDREDDFVTFVDHIVEDAETLLSQAKDLKEQTENMGAKK